MMISSEAKIKLMADYQCWCLWNMNEPDNINPDDLPISDDLKIHLHLWEKIFDQTLDLSDSNNIGFKTEHEYCVFYDIGWKLFGSLKLEMPHVEWWYRDRRYDHLLRENPEILPVASNFSNHQLS